MNAANDVNDAATITNAMNVGLRYLQILQGVSNQMSYKYKQSSFTSIQSMMVREEKGATVIYATRSRREASRFRLVFGVIIWEVGITQEVEGR